MDIEEFIDLKILSNFLNKIHIPEDNLHLSYDMASKKLRAL